jgi:hypothetical protein
VWRCEWNALLGSCSLYPAKLRTSRGFVPSFWDKTWDKTPFVRSPKMAENLVFFDRSKEPRDRIRLPPGRSPLRARLPPIRAAPRRNYPRLGPPKSDRRGLGQLFGVSFWLAPAALAPKPDFDDLPGKGLPCVEPGWPRK